MHSKMSEQINQYNKIISDKYSKIWKTTFLNMPKAIKKKIRIRLNKHINL